MSSDDEHTVVWARHHHGNAHVTLILPDGSLDPPATAGASNTLDVF